MLGMRFYERNVWAMGPCMFFVKLNTLKPKSDNDVTCFGTWMGSFELMLDFFERATMGH